jgi:glycosyltransferase involved in cell wall biosynthesis
MESIVTSIVIAAHNEAGVIGRCLDALLTGTTPGEFDVTVVANGCTDDTAQVAARAGVRVLDVAIASKVGALNVGDEVALGYPRVYLDADIVITAAGIRALCEGLDDPGTGQATGVLATTARREIDARRSSLPIRAYYAINSRLPVFQHALFGRGVIALSAEGRGRFGSFPAVVADDLFVDSLFASAEKREVDRVAAVVRAPRSTRHLLRRLTRVRRGNASMRAALPVGASHGEAARQGAGHRRARMSWLSEVVLPHPALIPAAICYAAITVTAAILARREQRPDAAWGRDDSSRRNDNPPTND